jgi:hypothetical protein
MSCLSRFMSVIHISQNAVDECLSFFHRTPYDPSGRGIIFMSGKPS